MENQRLRAENDYLKNLHALVSERVRREKAQVISALRHKHKPDILLEVAHLARSTYYFYEKRLNKVDKYDDARKVIAQSTMRTKAVMAAAVSLKTATERIYTKP